MKQKDFGEALGWGQSYISSLEKGHRDVSANVLRALTEHYSVSSDWLLTGQGPMFKEPGNSAPPALVTRPLAAAPAPLEPAQVPANWADHLRGARERLLTQTVDARGEPNIVLVPVRAQAGYAAMRVDPTYMQDLPAFNLPDDRFRTGTFRAFEVSGDSMEPTIFSNDVVVCRYVEDWRWLRDHELYVVVLREDVLVKRVRNHLASQRTLDLVSDNRFYPPITVPGPELIEVWQVAARLTTYLPAPPQG